MIRLITIAGSLCLLGLIVSGCSNNGPAQISTVSDEANQTCQIQDYRYVGNLGTTANPNRPAITASLSSKNLYVYDLVRQNGNKIQHLSKEGDYNWTTKQSFGLTQSTPAVCVFRTDGKLQVVSRENYDPTNKLVHYWLNSSNNTWVRQAEISTGNYSVCGSPSMICNLTGDANIELVTRDVTQVLHIWRSIDGNWSTPTPLPLNSGFKVLSDPVITQTYIDNMVHVVAITYTENPRKYYLSHWAKDAHATTWTCYHNFYDNGKIDRWVLPAIAARDGYSIEIIYKQTSTPIQTFKCASTLPSTSPASQRHLIVDDGSITERSATKGSLDYFAACSHYDGMWDRYRINTTFFDNGTPKNHHVSFISF